MCYYFIVQEWNFKWNKKQIKENCIRKQVNNRTLLKGYHIATNKYIYDYQWDRWEKHLKIFFVLWTFTLYRIIVKWLSSNKQHLREEYDDISCLWSKEISIVYNVERRCWRRHKEFMPSLIRETTRFPTEDHWPVTRILVTPLSGLSLRDTI